MEDTQEWLEQVRQKLKLKRQVLFDRDCPPARGVILRLQSASRRQATEWALRCAESVAERLNELRPLAGAPASDAIVAARLWARGDIKMPEAKRYILDCHDAAKGESLAEARALYHAVGQACSTVHTVRHAPGLCIYELTAIVLRYGADDCAEHIAEKVEMYERVLDKVIKSDLDEMKWAKFLK